MQTRLEPVTVGGRRAFRVPFPDLLPLFGLSGSSQAQICRDVCQGQLVELMAPSCWPLAVQGEEGGPQAVLTV